MQDPLNAYSSKFTHRTSRGTDRHSVVSRHPETNFPSQIHDRKFPSRP